jgi:hypothetical protein
MTIKELISFLVREDKGHAHDSDDARREFHLRLALLLAFVATFLFVYWWGAER